ncbi:heme NO-binding domain-containing protein [Vibrio sp. SCSIO 43135]|uniref:Heme NO-binding domain-containing protein n=1 Tax=Vibrio paucivorans TaxID=2829489 RepID=A0A9X3CBX3_9VIBR|nr:MULTISPECIES: heme NO-binding domain-containing protein [Vibrio]MCW8332912.1 heme NO-binding domain-containing protein [Vibrio paucivorans]USD42244.1 heme NO-binding domain-containing protein [Vibrio sp. SCSIO 43135]
MKGIIFTEFMELVEQEFGLEVLENMLDESGSEGIFTAVGSYDHRELVKMIVSLSKLTDVPIEALQEVFGKSVFNNLLNTLPNSAGLKKCANTFQFIRHVEEYIHLEVKKLYPDAKPPSFVFISETQTEMVFDYHSARCLSHVCLGLIQGCAQHFNEAVDVEMAPNDGDLSDVRFHLALG